MARIEQSGQATRRSFLGKMSALVAAVALTGCSTVLPPSTTPTAPVASTETIHKVAILVPLSGPNADIGTSIANAATLGFIDTQAATIRMTSYDTAAGADLTIITAPLVRGRIPCVVEKVLTRVTPGASVDVLVTDHGIAVNPARQDLIDNLRSAGIPLMTIEELQQRAELLTGKPQPIEFTDRVVAVVRYRDGSVIDVIHQVKNSD